ncbi:MAG: peptidoglycan-binding protein [Gemmatimonadota bacterium]
MIKLGSFDADTTPAARTAYLDQVKTLTRVALSEVAAGIDRLEFQPFAAAAAQSMSVADVQRGLTRAGFFPGGTVDGICGYRTQSAIRLFQEYVRSVEKQECLPDALFGPSTQRHLQRWLDGGLETAWAPAIARWQSGAPGAGEYADWLALLADTKANALSAPTRMLQLVNASSLRSDTRKVADWDTGPGQIHLIGIRRSQMGNKFDDIFVLLIKGLVFKFQGSTEPGASGNAAGRPFLVQGQHDYHYGWHQKKYLALRPQGAGVLIVRSRNNDVLDDADLANGLEANGTINIHWGGRGLTADVKTWSEGCQVINGSVYLGPGHDLVSCAAFAALNNGDIAANPSHTRGAYNVLLDLVTALGNDLTPTVKYTLLVEADLARAPALGQGLADARALVLPLLG